MRKILLRIILPLCIIVSGSAAAVFFLGQDTPAVNNGASLPAEKQARTAEMLTSPAAKIKIADENIHGQALYDARTALPPQAMLDIKLTETNPKTGAVKTAAETQEAILVRSPLQWTLPIKLSALDKRRSYAIQAKISGGDTLLFVNPAPDVIDASHSAYIIRLVKIDSGAADITAPRSFIGTDWSAVSLAGKAIEPNSEVSFSVGEEINADPAAAEKRYRVSGADGCNRYSGTISVDEKTKALQLSPLTAGFIACAPNLNRQEAEFLAIMSKARFYLIDETGTLSLLDAGKSPLARFTAVSAH